MTAAASEVAEAAQAALATQDTSPDIQMGNASTNASRGSQLGRGSYSGRGSRGGHRNVTQHKAGYGSFNMEVDYATLIANHFNGTRRSGDIPHTEDSKFKKWATSKRPVLSIPQPSAGTNIAAQTFGMPLRLPMTMSYNIFSQNPSINLHVREDKDAAYYPINIEMVDVDPEDGGKTIERVSLSEKELDAANINAAFKQVGCTVDAFAVAEMIRMGSKAKDPRAKGLRLMSIALPANFKLWLKRCSLKFATDNSDKFIKQVNAGRRLLVIRDNWFPQKHLDRYFDARGSTCAKNGIYPFYQPMTGETVGSRFKDFIGKDSKGELKHMPWMGHPMEKNQYSDFSPLGWFTSFKEYETVLSVEVIHDRETEKEVFGRIFSPTRQREIRAISRRENHWIFHVTMSRGDEKNVPSLSPGTTLTMRQVHVPAEFKIVRTKHGVDSVMEIDKSTPSTVFPEHKGKVIDVVTNADFAFSCIIPDNSIDDFVNLALRKAVFSIELKRVPSDRQLEAIAGLATLDSESNLGKLLLAKAFTELKDQPSLVEEYWSKLPVGTQTALQTYEVASERNVEQQKAVDLVFRGKKGTRKVR